MRARVLALAVVPPASWLYGKEFLPVEIAFLQRGWRVTASQPSEDGAAGMPALATVTWRWELDR
jgi:hypothetical protein